VKSSDILLLGGLLFLATRKSSTPTTPSDTYQPAATPLGVTASMVDAGKAAGLNNAQLIEAFLPKVGNNAVRVQTTQGGTRTISLPPPGSTRTSRNGNQYLAPRTGGGYKVVGARNIVLR